MSTWVLNDGSYLDDVPDDLSQKDLAQVLSAKGMAAPVRLASASQTKTTPEEYNVLNDIGSSSSKGAARAISAPYELAKSLLSGVGVGPPWWMQSPENRSEALRERAPFIAENATKGGLLGLPRAIGGMFSSVLGGSNTQLPEWVPDQKDTEEGFTNAGFPTRSGEQGFPGRVAEEVTAALLPLNVLGAASRMAPALSAPSGAIHHSPVMPSQIHPILKTFQQHPALVSAAEMSSAAGAGVGGYVGSQFGPPGETIGQIVGGMLNMPGTAATHGPGVYRKGKEVVSTYLPGKGREKAAAKLYQEALIEAGEDPAAVAKMIRPGTGITPAQQSGSQALMDIEQALIKKNPRKYAKYLADLRKRSSDELADLSSGDPQAVERFYQSRLERTQNAFQKILDNAADTAEAEIRKAGPAISRENTSIIYKNQMQKAYAEGDLAQKAAWARVNGDIPVDTSGIKQTYQEIMAEATKTGKTRKLPKFLKQFMSDKDGFADVESMDEIKDFRTDLMAALKDEKYRPSQRVLQQMVDASLEAMKGPGGKALEHARAVSRDFNIRFREGTVGQLRGRGAYRIGETAEGATLDSAIGTREDAVAATRMDDLLAAAPKESAEAQSALREFLRNRFIRAAQTPDGSISTGKAKMWLANNGSLMKRFPGLRDELKSAASTKGTLEDLTKKAESKLSRIGKEPVAEYLRAPFKDKLNKALDAKSPNASIKALARTARVDSTGQAMAGLKSQLIKEIHEGSIVQNLADGAHIGALPFNKRLKRFLPAIKELLSDKEIANLDKISKRITQAEIQLRSGKSLEELISSEPDMLFDLSVRVLGANVGGASALGQSAGAPLVLAGYGSRVARRVLEKVPYERIADVIEKAMFDEDFMKLLLETPTTAMAKRDAATRLHAFLINIIPEEEPVTEQ